MSKVINLGTRQLGNRTATEPGSRSPTVKVHIAGQKRGLNPAIKHAFRRRLAIERVIGHLKNEHRMNRNYLAGTRDDAANAVLATGGYNF